MIERLVGQIASRFSSHIIVDVNGVGYAVEMPLSSLCEMPSPGSQVTVWIDTNVREDAIRLFGFATLQDREMFRLVRQVNGVGPKTALALLSALNASQLRRVVMTGRQEVLESVPGVGARTAERMMLELKRLFEKKSVGVVALDEEAARSGASKRKPDGALFSEDETATEKLDFDEFSQDDNAPDTLTEVESALENLGYKGKVLDKVIDKVRSDLKKSDNKVALGFGDVLKLAMKELRRDL